MINFVATRDHQYPLKKMLKGKLGKIPFQWRQWSYEELCKKFWISTGTWIFQDMERLSEQEILRACKIASRLEDAGSKIINHPLRAASRYELQRKLFKEGLNKFQVYRADEHRAPKKWPVFIRFEKNHRSPNLNLIYTLEDLQKELQNYLGKNIPLSSLLIVEYYGEPNDDGLWRKFAAFRVGDKIIHNHIVIQDNWMAKYGNLSIEFDNEKLRDTRIFERDYVKQKKDPYNLIQAFKLGGIEFGRADFNIVKGRVQIYEINTNPTMGTYDISKDKLPEIPRSEIIDESNKEIIDALNELDIQFNKWILIGDINFKNGIPWKPIKRQ